MSEAGRQAALLRKERGTQACGWKRPIRTHCKKGHELIEENIYLRNDGERACRQCRTAYGKEWIANATPEQLEQVRLRGIVYSTQYNKDHPESFRKAQRKQDRRPEVKKRRSEFYEKTCSATWRKYSHLKARAKEYNRDMTLSQEEYELLVIDNKCHYCKGPLPKVGYGIDRLNHLLGYIQGNSVPCCKGCNINKGTLEGMGFRYPRTVELMMELKSNANTIMGG